MRQVLFLSLFVLLSGATLEAKPIFHFTGVDAIYGVDDRELITKKTSPKYRETARSVALIVSNDYLDVGMLKTSIMAIALQNNMNMCEGERFNEAMSLPGCTGFLVGEDLMVSAAHCFETAADCEGKKIIFDVDSTKQVKDGYSVFSKNVFACKEIVASGIAGSSLDYAVIRLEKSIKNRPYLKVRRQGKIEDKAAVFMIGHPMGMPLTLSKPERVSGNEEANTFSVGLDSFEGNSGSPVINAKTLEVEGILINGQQDVVLDSQKQCYRNVKHESGGEGVYRITGLTDFLAK